MVSISFNTESSLFQALDIFKDWSGEQAGTKKKYGMTRTASTSATFFFISDTPVHHDTIVSQLEQLGDINSVESQASFS